MGGSTSPQNRVPVKTGPLNYHIRGVQNAIREILSVLLIQVSDLLKLCHNDRPLKNRSQNGSQKLTLAASRVR